MSIERYRGQAEHNLKVAETLSSGDLPSLQWAVICMFYAGLHYVNAYFVQAGTPPAGIKSHGARDALIGRLMPQHVYRSYKWLKKRSVDMRYDLEKAGECDLEKSRERFKAIKTFVDSEIPTPRYH